MSYLNYSSVWPEANKGFPHMSPALVRHCLYFFALNTQIATPTLSGKVLGASVIRYLCEVVTVSHTQCKDHFVLLILFFTSTQVCTITIIGHRQSPVKKWKKKKKKSFHSCETVNWCFVSCSASKMQNTNKIISQYNKCAVCVNTHVQDYEDRTITALPLSLAGCFRK